MISALIKDIAIQQKTETSEIISDVKSPVLAGFFWENKATYASRALIWTFSSAA